MSSLITSSEVTFDPDGPNLVNTRQTNIAQILTVALEFLIIRFEERQ